MRSVEVLDETVPAPTAPTADRPSVAPTEGVSVRVRVWPRSHWLLETFDAADVVQEGDVWEASLVVANPAWLVRIAMGQAGGIEVLAPEEVRAQLHDAARSALDRMP